MTPGTDPVEDQTDAVLALLARVLPPGTVTAVALSGSAVAGGLRPESDLDLFGLLSRRLADGEKRALVEGLVPLSWIRLRPAAWRPLELTLLVHDEVRPWRYPPRFELQYGEWRREALLAADPTATPEANPDGALLLAMVRDRGIAVLGPPPVELLDPVPHADLVRAMLDELPALLHDLESDTRNVLLTLARMWTTVESGEIHPKDAAATWALAQLPAMYRPLLIRARDAYLGTAADAWEELTAIHALADELVARIRAAAASGRLPGPDASV